MKAFLAGLGVGAALGTILAPRSGRETREQLRSSASDMAGVLQQHTGSFREFAGEVPERIGALKQQARDLGESVATEVKSAAQGLASRAGLGALAKVNTASREDLMEVNGIGPVLADRIIAGRPFTSSRQLVERGILPESVFNELIQRFEAA